MMQQDSVFLHHEPCPYCGSKDNMGVWSDGHKYCFGCHRRQSGTKTISSMKQKLKEMAEEFMGGQVNESTLNLNLEDYTFDIPIKARNWLKKYGITDLEIKNAKLAWNNNSQSLVFPIYNKGVLRITNERYFGDDPDHPKYITKGPKTKYGVVMTPSQPIKSNVIIVTEDFVSAMKVARQYNSYPVLGTDLPASTAASLSERFTDIRVWLDRDKAAESLQQASRAFQYGFDTSRSIVTDLDPKEYSDEDIKKHIEESL